MLSEILDSIFKELNKGITIKGHPFRYTCLTTVDSKNKPQPRMVVIRKITENKITIYTDSRTEKVADLKKNNFASLLFYDYKKLKQLKLSGEIAIDDTPDKKLWNTIPENAKKDYTTKLKPGSAINNPDLMEYSENENHFCVLTFTFTAIDYLKITRPNHVKTHFLFKNDNWSGTFLIP